MPGKSFFSAFKSNFKSAIIIWLIILGLYLVTGMDCYIFVYVIGNHGSRIVFAADDHDRDCLNNDMGNLRVSVSGAFRKYYEK